MPQQQLVGGHHTGRRGDLQSGGVTRRQPWQEVPDDRAGNFVLDGEDVVQLAVEAFRPQLETTLRVDELRRDSHLLAVFADAAFDHVRDSQPLRDRAHVRRVVLERKCRAARHDLQAGCAREAVDEFLSEPVTEILVGGIAADVGEGQDGDRDVAGLRCSRALQEQHDADGEQRQRRDRENGPTQVTSRRRC
jgi:hypothetical protein